MKFSLLTLFTAFILFSFSIITPHYSYSAEGVTTYTVITRGTTKPCSYFDENDRLTGYDVELLRLIEKKNPSIHFEFKTMSVSAGFLALDSGQADLIANQMTKNPQREKKYLFSKQPNNYTSTRLAVHEKNTDIKSLEDLDGKTVITTATNESVPFLKQYAKDHKLTIHMLYTDKGVEEGLNAITTGKADATPSYSFLVPVFRKELGFAVKLVGPVLLSDPTYFILRKSPETEALANIIDATMKDMHADGTLKTLSEKFFEADYTFPQN